MIWAFLRISSSPLLMKAILSPVLMLNAFLTREGTTSWPLELTGDMSSISSRFWSWAWRPRGMSVHALTKRLNVLPSYK